MPIGFDPDPVALIGLAQYASGGKLGLELLGESERSFFEMKAGVDFVSRVAGTLGHPNKLAALLGILIPLNIALVFGAESRPLRGLLMVPLTVMATAMVLTYSRGGWLGLAAGVTMSPHQKDHPARKPTMLWS